MSVSGQLSAAAARTPCQCLSVWPQGSHAQILTDYNGKLSPCPSLPRPLPPDSRLQPIPGLNTITPNGARCEGQPIMTTSRQ